MNPMRPPDVQFREFMEQGNLGPRHGLRLQRLRGSPSAFSAMMLRWTSLVPP